MFAHFFVLSPDQPYVDYGKIPNFNTNVASVL
ncbi:hypothetical protein HmCmsJML029_01159 [Escherichia coli]|nr:hypothetical protein HmCmsJML029_01159 [Escherichia coli]GDQ69285.1 hypothetical protein BvCmsNSP045_01627 [Escherichia coli]